MSFRTRTPLVLVTLACTSLMACGRTAPVPEGEYVGTVNVKVSRKSGATSADLDLRLLFGKENGKDMVAFGLPIGGGQCSGEVRSVNDTLVADTLKCEDPYIPTCTITAVPLVLERKEGGVLRSRVFTTSMADVPACTDRAGARNDYAPGDFRGGSAPK